MSASDVGTRSTEPASLSGVDCVGVFVGYLDADNPGSCTTTLGSVAIAKYDGLFPYNSGQSRTVKIGGLQGNKTVELVVIGFKTPDGSCVALNSSFNPSTLSYSEPYVLGSSTVFLQDGAESNANIALDFDSANHITGCSGASFDKDTSLSSNVVAYWNFDSFWSGGIGDSTGSSRNLANTLSSYSNLSASIGLIGRSLIGNGIAPASYSSYAVYSSYNPGDGFLDMGAPIISKTFSFWVYPNATFSNSIQHVIDSRSSGSSGFRVYFEKSTTSVSFLKFELKQSGSSETIASACTLSNSVQTWNHFAVTLDFSTQMMLFYRNGMLCDSEGFTKTSTASNNTSFLGKGGVTGNASGFEGHIDSIGVWNSVLTPSQIQSLFSRNQSGDDIF